VQHEHDLEKGGVAQVAGGLEILHQKLEGEILVEIGPEGRPARLVQDLLAVAPRIQFPTQHQGIGEKADERFQLREAPGRGSSWGLLPAAYAL